MMFFILTELVLIILIIVCHILANKYYKKFQSIKSYTSKLKTKYGNIYVKYKDITDLCIIIFVLLIICYIILFY